MNTLSFSWVPVDTILPLRHDVIIVGTDRPTDLFPGDTDPCTFHVAAYRQNQLIGCASFMRNSYQGADAFQLRGMAVDPDAQGQGIGRQLLEFALSGLVRMTGVQCFWCNARKTAVQFYKQNGWQIVSEEFMTPGVGPHYKMIFRGKIIKLDQRA